ncbi:MAG: hypothetical protein A3F54_02710 [Candidatus Kerfeldbacteria bacterium RIFCSPHIGHO2_12_FULL_48_17]|uniref:DNA primase/polymerase bifunctional N-terminal domain-containing protein n=1 Tax=Candidatus Kerfeldbacteria bacterium RIFCSPHIGHO2_12_FULL_48_17 TaxID=1798542 RepID=A0A1G2B7F1_9BACT|nr:MAG: hypothetical protein A3F54_02710 [Candidatus Kerfeldbacteria bacterium RIFCSPHIGHO2_12_FULL_48_17]
MDKLENILRFAGLGFYVFPCQANSKLPAIKEWPAQATRDVRKIRQWWTNGFKDCNFGIYTGKFGSPDNKEGLLVIDVDVKGEKKGNETVFDLELQGLNFPETFTQTTPSGGMHYVYRVPRSAEARSGTNILGPGVDIRANGGYVVGSGSSLPNGVYRHSERGLAKSPVWVMERVRSRQQGHSHSGAVASGRIENINKDSATARARHYLAFEASPAAQGDGGDLATYRTAARVKDLGVEEKECLELMLELWNDQCVPSWSRAELKTKVHNAYRYGEKPIGAAAPEAKFPKVEKNAKSPSQDDSYLEDINKDHALVFIGGGHAVLFDTTDEKGRKTTEFMNEGAFKRKFSTKTISYGKRTTTWANAWLDWPGRKEFRGIAFAPERKITEGFYNTWKGFTCSPMKYEDASSDAQNGFRMFKQFTLNTICHNDHDLFSWLISYCAHMVQRPYERPLTTLVFQGKKGTGKNEFIERIGDLFGSRHYRTAHNIRYLTSNFNGHLDACLCMVLDEAFWSGDKAAESQLKGLTTASEIMIERKGEEPYVIDNLVRVVVIGNERWLVPATEDERRYAVFRFGDDKQCDTAFFVKMKGLMREGGGNQVLLHYLKHWDISNINLGWAPKTEGLLDQKLASGAMIEKWWFDCLNEMKIAGDEFEHEWPEKILRDRLRDAFKKYCKDHNVRGWVMDDYSFGKNIRKYVPSIGTTVQRTDGIRRYCYSLPPIEACRKEWAMFVGQRVKWELNVEPEGGKDNG